MTLTRRLSIFLVLALLPVVALDVDNALRSHAEATRNVHETAMRLVSMVEGEQARVVDGVRNVLVTLRRARAVRDGDAAICQDIMRDLRPDYPAHLNLHVLDRSGTIRCSTMPTAVGIDLSDRPFVRNALAGRPMTLGPAVTARSNGRLILPMGMPIIGRDGDIAGVVSAAIDVSWIDGFLAQKPLPPNAILTIADANGIILARRPHGDLKPGERLDPVDGALFAEQSPGTREVRGMDGVRRIVAFSPIGRGVEGLFLSIAMDRADALAPIDRDLASSLGLLALTVAASWIAALLLGRRHLYGPLRRLTETARRWSAGDLSARADAGASDLARLAADLNGMADALAARNWALHESETRYRAIFETAVDSMVVIDDHGIIQSANPATERAFGYTMGDMRGRNVSMLMPPADAAIHDGHIARYLATGERRIIGIGCEVVGLRKDGTILPMVLSIAEWRDGLGRRFFTGIMRDNSARVKSERDLEARAARLRLLADLSGRLLTEDSPDEALRLVVANGPRGLGLDVVLGYEANPGAQTIHLTHSHGIGAEAVDALRSIPYGAMLCGQVAASRRPVVLSDLEIGAGEPPAGCHDLCFRAYAAFPLLDGRGELLGVLAFASRTRARFDPEDVELLATVAHHVSAVRSRLLVSNALAAAKREAEVANAAKSRFLAAASHDLRQPVQAMALFAGVLERHVADGPGREALLHLGRGLDGLKGMLDGLLDVTRLEAGAIVPDVRAFAIAPLLEEIASSYATVAEAKGLRFAVQIDEPVAVKSDQVLLARMLRNLLENAIRYTDAGGTVRLECRRTDVGVRLSVVDDGMGIPEAQQARIFDEFHQVANPGRNREEGLGLGLAIVKRLSRLLLHPVTVRSAPGAGSRFSIDVPAAPVAVATPAAPSGTSVAAAHQGRGRVALVVDDDAIVLLGLKQMLEGMDYAVVMASDPDQAEARVAKDGRTPDLVISDYRLRDGRVGTEAVSRVRALTGTTIPGFLLTGEAGPEAAADAADHGLGLIHKPVTPRQLSQVLGRMLGAA